MEIFNKDIILEQTWNELFNPVVSGSSNGEAHTFDKKIITDSIFERCHFVPRRSGARVEILNNYELGLEMFNADGNSRFRYYVDGINTGDFVVGDTAGNYWWWDDSLGVMTIKGHITASTIDASDITGGTITGSTIQTALTGKRIKISSNPQNKIEFFNDNTLIGVFEVDYDAGTSEGYLDVIDGSGNGMGTITSLTGTYFSQAALFSLGGMIVSYGETGAGAAGIYGSDNANYIFVGRLGTDYGLYTDLEFDMGVNKIVSLGAPTGAADATTKKYVDDADDLLATSISDLTTAVSDLTTAVSGINDRLTWVEDNCC